MKLTYWIITGLLSFFIVGGAVPDILMIQGAKDLFAELGYPDYLLLIVGWAKILGVIGILQTKWPFLREWAYFGLIVDLGGAFLSHTIVAGGFDPLSIPSLVGLVLTVTSYVLLRKAYGKESRLAELD